ncbi:ubiquitin carboxyl-terminal hydrolase [Anaeramoeba flamelloides]|uniref:Ubiquitin carboxyl-terminal hydrolase n=1 Tax=Anaeramoeba flamelloides TaxID=1746091 RepID=A0AAV8AC11_9EUKA|nr:ubiquitin carboxyl-terminal hydrolase [Anaeramoeba flamelloides]
MILKIFQNLLKHYNCKECSHLFERKEEFFTLSLNIKKNKSLEELLNLFFQQKILNEEIQISCEGCVKKTLDSKYYVQNLPKNLIIHLKIFEYDFITKRKKLIQLGNVLNPPLDICIQNVIKKTEKEIGKEQKVENGNGTELGNEINEMSKNDSHDYKLFGIIYHNGKTQESDYCSEFWYGGKFIPSEHNTPINMNKNNNQSKSENNNDKYPYILFYTSK